MSLKEKAWKMFEAGKTVAQVASAMGVQLHTAKKWLLKQQSKRHLAIARKEGRTGPFRHGKEYLDKKRKSSKAYMKAEKRVSPTRKLPTKHSKAWWAEYKRTYRKLEREAGRADQPTWNALDEEHKTWPRSGGKYSRRLPPGGEQSMAWARYMARVNIETDLAEDSM